MNELITNIMAMFTKPWAKVAALAIICVTVVALSTGCAMSASGIVAGDYELDEITVEFDGDF